MEDMIPCSLNDQEVFQRVWQRVMAGRSEEGSLIRPGPVDGGDVPCRKLTALAGREEAPAQPAPPAPEEPPSQSAPSAGPDGDWAGGAPPLWEEPPEGDERAARLRGHVMDALEGWQFYRHLARRAKGTDARTLNSLAGELHRHARKLSAAYFLLTGLRYWPTQMLGAPAIPSYWGALRARHQAEQRLENLFRLAADDWEDPEMLAMYNELAGACQQRCRRLRGLLEQGV